MKEPAADNPCLIAIDPGRDKCGYAVVSYDLTLLEKGIVPPLDVDSTVTRLMKFHPDRIVMGSGTAGKSVAHSIEALQLKIPVAVGEEKNTTYEARTRYFRDHPPTGFWRLVPLSLQYPGIPIDDYAAWLIGEKYILDNGLGRSA